MILTMAISTDHENRRSLMHDRFSVSFQFSRNVFVEFAEFSDKIFVITVKGFEPVISCVGNQDATTVPARRI